MKRFRFAPGKGGFALGSVSKRSLGILPVAISLEYSGWKPKLR